MKRIPHAREVEQALRSTERAVKTSLQLLNEVAGGAMSKGNYAMAESLADKGREIQQYLCEVQSFHKKWKTLCQGGAKNARQASTPQWSYYQPILKALVELGGQATSKEIEPVVESQMQEDFQPGDVETMSRGQKRWQVMVKRARKHLMEEGWLEGNKGAMWKITTSGRTAAKASAKRFEKDT